MTKPKKQLPSPPAHLSAAAKKFWREINEEFELESQDLQRLEIACTALDRAAQARAKIKKDGPTIVDRFKQVRRHPCVAIERDSAKLYLQAIRQMGVDVESGNGAGLSPITPPRAK